MKRLDIGSCYITTKQLQEANAESIRLGFSRNLNLPPDLPHLKFPVVAAHRHAAADGKENVRLTLFFALDTEAGSDGQPVFLDVTPDCFALVRSQQHSIVA